MGRQYFQFDQLGGAGYKLRGLQDGAVLRRRAVDGQQVIPGVQRAAPGGTKGQEVERDTWS